MSESRSDIVSALPRDVWQPCVDGGTAVDRGSPAQMIRESRR